MEAAVRWSQRSTSDSRRFLIADVVGNRLQYCQIDGIEGSRVNYKVLSQRDKLPNFTAFDWSRKDETLVAIGTSVGETKVLRLDSFSSSSDSIFNFPVKLQRKCNSIAWSHGDLLAVGLDRIRGDSSLNVYDVRAQSNQVRTEPLKKLTGAEVITNVKFFTDGTLLAGSGGIARHGQNLKLYDIRESSNSVVASIPTRHVHLLSVNQLDENYFASAGPPGENAVSIWDRRSVGRFPLNALSEPSLSSAVLELRPAIDANSAHIWGLRYSCLKRGWLGVISSTGQVRVFDTVEQTSHVNSREQLRNHSSETIHFTRHIYDLQRPWTDSRSSQDESSRAIAFDFTNFDAFNGKSLLFSIQQNRSIELTTVPSQPRMTVVTPVNDFIVLDKKMKTWPQHVPARTIAEDLIYIQKEAMHASSNGQGYHADSATSDANQTGHMGDDQKRLTSLERHAKLLEMSNPHARLGLDEILVVMDTQRRRCFEGYLFDSEHNQTILKNDRWLVEAWNTVKRLNHMASSHGMVHQGQDFSYLGVRDIWKADFGPNPSRIWRRALATRKDSANAATIMMATQGYGKFDGIDTEYPGLRQLGLAICDWRFDERRLREKCTEIVSRKQYYKAMVVAVCHGRKDIAIDMLKTLTRTKVLDNSGLAAVIACEIVTEEQRELCEWMAEEADDPYLRALLAYFVTGQWETVVEMAELPLIYRVAVALKYLDDTDLGEFLETATRDAIANGDIEGIVLTGLSEPSMDLLQNYIAKFNDVQSAVLISSFTNPLYVQDERWQMWRDAYLDNMQAWGAFMQRGRFVSQHTRLAISRTKQKLIQPPPNQLSVRCLHCQGSIAKRDEGYDSSDDETQFSIRSSYAPTKSLSSPSGNTCPKCAAHMTRCAVCQLWQGSPDPSNPAAAAALSEQDLMSVFLSFCITCNHGFHANHAREWFTQYNTCAVPDCHCTCTLDI